MVGLPINREQVPIEDWAGCEQRLYLVVFFLVEIEDLLYGERPVVLSYLLVGWNVRSFLYTWGQSVIGAQIIPRWKGFFNWPQPEVAGLGQLRILLSPSLHDSTSIDKSRVRQHIVFVWFWKILVSLYPPLEHDLGVIWLVAHLNVRLGRLGERWIGRKSWWTRVARTLRSCCTWSTIWLFPYIFACLKCVLVWLFIWA